MRGSCAIFFFALAALLGTRSAPAACLFPPGDVSGDGIANVVDVQCNVVANLWSLEGQVGAAPPCLVGELAPNIAADHTCDGVVSVSDTQLAVVYALGMPLSPVIDPNGNQCPDVCEVDSDGDGAFDTSDCAPHDADIAPLAAEICNGWDDDCSGASDEIGALALAQSCSDGDLCTGVETCLEAPGALGGLVLSEIHITPLAATEAQGEWVEIANLGGEFVNIRGYKLRLNGIVDVTIDPGGALFVPPQGYVLVGDSIDPQTNGGLRVSAALSGLTLSTPTGSVALLNATGAELDFVSWGPGADLEPGASFARVDLAAPASNPLNWVASSRVLPSGDRGTPAGPNADVSPSRCLPGTAVTCPPGGACATTACVPASGSCVSTPAPAGQACDDGEPCTVGDACAAGVCVGAVLSPCCGDGSCEVSEQCGCVADCEGLSCNDGNAATSGDVCGANGACVGSNACSNGAQDPGEAAVDCGGGCPPCAVGSTCAAAVDCQSGYCQQGRCADPMPCWPLPYGSTGALGAVVLGDGAVINTTDGTITQGATVWVAAGASGVELVSQPQQGLPFAPPSLRVFHVQSLEVLPGATVSVVGQHALAVASRGPVLIRGKLDAAGKGAGAGSTNVPGLGGAAGPGGGAGGQFIVGPGCTASNGKGVGPGGGAAGPCGGSGGKGGSASGGAAGGGGGGGCGGGGGGGAGHVNPGASAASGGPATGGNAGGGFGANSGGSGGFACSGTQSAAGGGSYGDPGGQVLYGGSGGGAGGFGGLSGSGGTASCSFGSGLGGVLGLAGGPGGGGGGGGAVLLCSAARVEVVAGGEVSARGGFGGFGGFPATAENGKSAVTAQGPCGGGGGAGRSGRGGAGGSGAGGSIKLRAPQVIHQGLLDAAGGSPGNGFSGSSGAFGGNGLNGGASGGQGGAGGGGGSGGAASSGRVRLEATSLQNNGTTAGSFSAGPL